MKSHRVLYIGACFGLSYRYDNWDYNMFCSDDYSIRELKMPSIKYSKRMLNDASAVDMYLIKRAELYRKLTLVLLFYLFNYAVPLPEG